LPKIALRRPNLRPPRLLPVVIAATVALLIFKGIGLVTEGGYVLTGVQPVAASEGAAPPPGQAAEADAAASGPTVSDSSPTITDAAPTLAPPPAAHGAAGAGHGAPDLAEGAAGPSGGTPGAAAGASETASASPPSSDSAGGAEAAIAASGAGQGANSGTAAGGAACPPNAGGGSSAAEHGTTGGEAGSAAGGMQVPAGCAPPDAVPMKIGANGQPEPLDGVGGTPLSEQVLLQRLSQRRAELDQREQQLGLREATIAAAEKQMAARADELKRLQQEISALQQQKQAAQGDEIAGIVQMYSTMKPQEAAGIFDGLDMAVLFRVAKAMDPRKMSAILAKMNPGKAQELTIRIADGSPPAEAANAGAAAPAPGSLPQIVGH
jgi:flagellar motility protein MotE (MotC chaperone)